MVFIDLMSDLHIDLCNNLNSITELVGPVRKTSNRILILAGDIGNPTTKKYWDFLESCCMIYQNVIFITGNHEYYNNKYTESEINNLIINKPKPTNLHFLYKNKIVLNGVTFFGTTLWTQINKKYSKELAESINDSRCVLIESKTGKKKIITLNDWDNLHLDQLNWLKQEIELEQSDKIVVITHHLPTPYLSHEKYRKYECYDSAFFTDLSTSGVFSNKIKLWVCGHTHTKMNYVEPKTGTQFHVNPLGYTGENSTYDVAEFEL